MLSQPMRAVRKMMIFFILLNNNSQVSRAGRKGGRKNREGIVQRGERRKGRKREMDEELFCNTCDALSSTTVCREF